MAFAFPAAFSSVNPLRPPHSLLNCEATHASARVCRRPLPDRVNRLRGSVLGPGGGRAEEATRPRRLVPARRAGREQEGSARWLADGSRDRARRLEEGEPDGRAPIVSPDGKWIAFLSTRPRPADWKQTPAAPPSSDPPCDVWLMPVQGGAATPL